MIPTHIEEDPTETGEQLDHRSESIRKSKQKSPAKARLNLIVDGDIQYPDYRPKVRKSALKYNIVGFVQYQNDGTTKIICEGKKDDLRRFLRSIKIRNGPLYVDNIKITRKKATGEFTRFRMIQGYISDYERAFCRILDKHYRKLAKSLGVEYNFHMPLK